MAGDLLKLALKSNEKIAITEVNIKEKLNSFSEKVQINFIYDRPEYFNQEILNG